MAKGRYSGAKGRTKHKSDDENKWFAPNMWGDHRYPIVKAALDSVDEVARTLEQRWGIGRLQRIAPPDLAVKFAQATENFNEACNQDDHNYMVQKANNLIAGWKALERSAEKNGFSPADPKVWYLRAPDDALDGKPFAIIENTGDYKRIEPDTVKRIYTLDEICRFIQFWEEKNSMANTVKDTFPGSHITSIKPNKENKEEFFDDEIPF